MNWRRMKRKAALILVLTVCMSFFGASAYQDLVIGSLWWTNKLDSPLMDPQSTDLAWWNNDVIISDLQSNFVSTYYCINQYVDPSAFQDIDQQIGYHVDGLDVRYWVRPAELCQYAIDLSLPGLAEAQANGLSVIPSVNTYCYSQDGYQDIYDTKLAQIAQRLAAEEITPAEAQVAYADAEKYNPANLPGRQRGSSGTYSIPQYGGVPISCISNDYWIAVQAEVAQMHAQAGYPGIYYDLYPYGSGAGLLCCCDSCQAKWAAYSAAVLGEAKPFPTALNYTSANPEESAVSIAFYQFRREELNSFIGTMEEAGQEYVEDFRVYLNASIDNMSHQGAILDGLYQPTSELHALTTGDMSGLYLFKMAEAVSDKQLLCHYNSSKSQISKGFYQMFTIMAEAYAGGGGYLFLAANAQQRPEYREFADFLVDNRAAYENTAPVADTAILYSWEDHALVQVGNNVTKTAMSPWGKNSSRRAAELLAKKGIPYEYLSAEKNAGNLSAAMAACKTVVLPELQLVDDSLSAALQSYVQQGGTLLVLGAFGTLTKSACDGGTAFTARTGDLIDSWTQSTTNKTYSVTPLGSGKIIRVGTYAANDSSALYIRPSAALKDAFAEADIYNLLKVSENLNGSVESTLRTDAEGNLYLNLINFGTGSNAGVEDEAYHVSLALPQEMQDGYITVTAEAPFALPITKTVSENMLEEDTCGYTPARYTPTLDQCRIIDGRLELHGNFGLYSLISIKNSETEMTPVGPQEPIVVPENDELPLEVSSMMASNYSPTVDGGSMWFRVVFDGTHTLVDTDGILWAVMDKDETARDVEWHSFTRLRNAGLEEFGGVGYRRYAWDAVFMTNDTSQLPALSPGQRLLVKVRKDKVAEHPLIGDRTMQEDAIYEFTSANAGTVGTVYSKPIRVESASVGDEDNLLVRFKDHYVDIGPGGLQYAVMDSDGLTGAYTDLVDLEPLRPTDGSYAEDMYDWSCPLPQVTLAAGEKLIVKLVASEVEGMDIGAGATEFVPNGLTMRDDIYFIFGTMTEGTVGKAHIGEPIAVLTAKVNSTQAWVRVTFDNVHVRVDADGMKWAVMDAQGQIGAFHSFTQLRNAGQTVYGGVGYASYAWDAMYALSGITLGTGEKFVIRIDASKVTELIYDTETATLSDGIRRMAEDAYFVFDSLAANTYGEAYALPPVAVHVEKVNSTQAWVRVTFDNVHVRVDAGGMKWAVMDAQGRIGAFHSFTQLRNAGQTLYGGVGYASYAWDAMYALSGITLGTGEKFVIRIDASKVTERVYDEASQTVCDGVRRMEEDSYYVFDSLAANTYGSPYTPPEPEPIAVHTEKVNSTQAWVRVTFDNVHVRVDAGGMQWAVMDAQGYIGTFSPFTQLRNAGQTLYGGVGYASYAWDAIYALTGITLGAGEKFVLKIDDSKVTELNYDATTQTLYDGNRRMAEDAYYVFDSLAANTSGQAYTLPDD